MSCRCFLPLSNGQPSGGGVVPPVVFPVYDLWGLPATLDVTGTTEVDVLDYVLPANRIADDGDAVFVRVYGDWQYPAGAGTMNYRLTWQLGASILWQGNTNLVPASASRYPFFLDVAINRKGAALCSAGGLQHMSRGTTLPSSFGLGALTQSSTTLDGTPMDSGALDIACDWTSPQAITLLVRPNTTGATLSVRGAQIWTPSA